MEGLQVNKIIILSFLIGFWLFVPFFLMSLNYSGFSQLEYDSLLNIQSNDFNLFTFTGFGSGIQFILDLGSYTLQGMPVFINLVLLFFAIISVMVGFLVARGGGS